MRFMLSELCKQNSIIKIFIVLFYVSFVVLICFQLHISAVIYIIYLIYQFTVSVAVCLHWIGLLLLFHSILYTKLYFFDKNIFDSFLINFSQISPFDEIRAIVYAMLMETFGTSKTLLLPSGIFPKQDFILMRPGSFILFFACFCPLYDFLWPFYPIRIFLPNFEVG